MTIVYRLLQHKGFYSIQFGKLIRQNLVNVMHSRMNRVRNVFVYEPIDCCEPTNRIEKWEHPRVLRDILEAPPLHHPYESDLEMLPHVREDDQVKMEFLRVKELPGSLLEIEWLQSQLFHQENLIWFEALPVTDFPTRKETVPFGSFPQATRLEYYHPEMMNYSDLHE